jgi:signal transduction histidine kinase
MKNLKYLTDALKNLNKRLERRDKQRRKYAAKLKLQNKQNTEVIEAIGHEFKNPVAAIMGYAQTIIEDPEIDSKLLAKFLDKIYQNANSISNMVDRLAIAAKLESNMLAPHFATIVLKPLIEDVVSQISIKYQKAQIEVVCGSAEIFADNTMIRMILTNLIDNACKYGGGKVSVNVICLASKIIISIKDKGQGIEPTEIEKLTQKFYRIRQNGWDNSLGLGLAIVEYLLKLHNSELLIKSEIGVGSEFVFSL